jgi:hypothetical protein
MSLPMRIATAFRRIINATQFLILWYTQTGDHPEDLPATWYRSKRMWGSFYFLGYLLEPIIRIWQFNWRVFLLGEIIEAPRLSNMKIVWFCKMIFPTQNNFDISVQQSLVVIWITITKFDGQAPMVWSIINWLKSLLTWALATQEKKKNKVGNKWNKCSWIW